MKKYASKVLPPSNAIPVPIIEVSNHGPKIKNQIVSRIFVVVASGGW